MTKISPKPDMSLQVNAIAAARVQERKITKTMNKIETKNSKFKTMNAF